MFPDLGLHLWYFSARSWQRSMAQCPVTAGKKLEQFLHINVKIYIDLPRFTQLLNSVSRIFHLITQLFSSNLRENSSQCIF